MIVYYDNIIPKTGLLEESAFHRVCNGLLPVEHGYDNRSLIEKLLLGKIWLTIVSGIYQRANLLQVTSRHLLHFQLHVAIAWIHVVELFFPTLTSVMLSLGIEIFIDMEELSLTAQEETQVI